MFDVDETQVTLYEIGKSAATTYAEVSNLLRIWDEAGSPRFFSGEGGELQLVMTEKLHWELTFDEGRLHWAVTHPITGQVLRFCEGDVLPE